MKSFAPVNEKEFETAGLFIFGGLSLIMAILKLANGNSPLAKPSRKGDKFFDHMWSSEFLGLNYTALAPKCVLRIAAWLGMPILD